MASCKSEVLHQAYRKRLRPPHPLRIWPTAEMGPHCIPHPPKSPTLLLSRWAIAHPSPKPWPGWTGDAGIPQSAPQSFRTWAALHGLPIFDAGQVSTDQVLLVADTVAAQLLTSHRRGTGRRVTSGWLLPRVADPARMLRAQLDLPKTARRDTEGARPDHRSARPCSRGWAAIVGIEPSRAAALRHEAAESMQSADARLVQGATVTLAELLTRTPQWTTPDRPGCGSLPNCTATTTRSRQCARHGRVT